MKRYLMLFALIISTVVANAQQTPVSSKSITNPCANSRIVPCIPPKQPSVQLAKLEAKHGIRDIKLDTPISQYNDLIEIENPVDDDIKLMIELGKLNSEDSVFYTTTYKNIKFFKRANENLLFGDVQAYQIRYLYIENNLVGIYIYFDSGWDYHKLIKVLTKLYGEPMDIAYGRNKTWFANTFRVVGQWEQADSFGGEIFIFKNDLPLLSVN